MASPACTSLIAEDELLVSRAARLEQEQAGHTVFDAADGDEAVEVFIANYDQIDLVLLDRPSPDERRRCTGANALCRPRD